MRALRLSATALLLAALAAAPTRANAPGLGGIEARDVREALGLYNRLSAEGVPLLRPDQVEALLQGEVVKVREIPNGPDQPQRVVGYVLYDLPRPQVWIASTDPHAGYSGGILQEDRIVNDDAGTSVWYQHLKLPWPVQNRHWLIRIKKDRDLATRSDARIWQMAWNLDEKGESFIPDFIRAEHIRNTTLEEAQKAIYTPVNHGGWILITMPENCTLLMYHVTSVVGGSIPDSFVSEWAMLTLDDLLKKVGEFSRTMPQHYVEGHDAVRGADGVTIPYFAKTP
jgi:hypothetical protein